MWKTRGTSKLPASLMAAGGLRFPSSGVRWATQSARSADQSCERMVRSENRREAANPAVGGVYHRSFWFAYVANFVLCVANAVPCVRFAELVAWLGGTEQAVGVIVGTGLFGVLIVRLILGQGIDRYGTRTVWTVSALFFIVGSGAFLACHDVSWGLYVARTIYSIGLAGMFTCSIVYVQNIVPLDRRTEAIGSLGTSGFLGIIAGSSLGDAIFATYPLAAHPKGARAVRGPLRNDGRVGNGLPRRRGLADSPPSSHSAAKARRRHAAAGLLLARVGGAGGIHLGHGPEPDDGLFDAICDRAQVVGNPDVLHRLFNRGSDLSKSPATNGRRRSVDTRRFCSA